MVIILFLFLNVILYEFVIEEVCFIVDVVVLLIVEMYGIKYYCLFNLMIVLYFVKEYGFGFVVEFFGIVEDLIDEGC